MDRVSMTWLMIYELRVDDGEIHFWDSDPTEQITTKVPIRHEQPVIKSITKGDVKKISIRERLG